MARTKATKKNASKNALPRGFKAVSGFGESWPGQEPKVGVELQGTITGFDTFKAPPKKGEKKGREVGIARIEADDGKMYSVWESSGLRPLFACEEGAEVYLRFDGMGRAKKGQNAPKLYTVAVKE